MKIARHLEVDVNGLNLNELLKKIENSGKKIKEVQRVSHTNVKFVVKKKVFSKFLEKQFFSCYNVNTSEVKSLIFLLLCAPSRIGVLAGLLVSILSCFLITSSLFDVDVLVSDGNTDLKKQIEICLAENGIKDGMKISAYDRKQIELLIFSEFDEVSNVSVRRVGVKLFVSVQTATLSPEIIGPTVARFDGVVEKIVVKTGKPMVKKGDTVKIGQVLVEPDSNGVSVACVLAKVWFESSSTVEAKKTEFVRTGKKSKIESLELFGKVFKSSGKQNDFDFFEEEQTSIWIFDRMFVPFKKITTTRFELMQVENDAARKLQIEKARARAEKNTRCMLPFGIEPTLISFFVREDEFFVTVDCFVETLIEIQGKGEI